MKLARRVTGRPAIVAFQGAFHGRTYGATSITSSSPNYRQGYEPLLPSVYLAPFPPAWRGVGGDAARGGAPGGAGPRHLRGAGPGRGRVPPGPGRLPAWPPRAVRRARDPARGRRGPDRLRPDRPGVGLRARRRRPRRRLPR